MSKIYELYLQILIQQQYSPTITTISRYEPDNFINDENPLMMADKIRVLRYRSEKIIFKESTLNNYLFQFSNNRNLFIHFLRRLTSPIFDYELQDQKSIENIILQIELDSILLEQIGLWNNNFNLTIQQLEAIFLCQKMNEFQQCLLNIKQNQLNQICQINEYDLKHETEITLPNFEYFEQQFYQCNYKINSKKKVVQFTHKKELCQSDQNKIIKIIQKKKLQNIRDVFQLIMNQFGLQFNINYQELQNNNEWICELSAKEIYTKQKSNNKSQAFLNAQIHVLKQISPLILDFLLENSDQNLDQIKQNKGLLNLKISVLKQCGIMPKEDFLRLVPYNYELIENYIESKPNTETCAIRKLQNDITNYLITKYHQLGVNKQLLSIASTYELTMSFSDGQETKTINKIFTTKLRFCNARLIGQQYIINVIGERIFGREKCEQFETIEMQKIIEASYIERFLYKVLHPKEIEQFKSKITIEQKSQFLASRWAVKEALVKASQYKELVFPQTEISRINGKPEIILHDQNDEYFKQQFSEDYETQLSISHEDQFSIAFVILLK